MGLNRQIRKVAGDWFDLPSDVINDEPRVEMVGKSRLDVENHQGLVLFCSEELKLRTNRGIIHVLGKGLKIRMINPYMISISGEITKIEYDQ